MLISLLVAGSLTGCVASTVASVVTAPVRVAGKAADWATTSRSEADRNRGRAMRHREERLHKLDRAYRESRRACDNGEQNACERARGRFGEIKSLTPTGSAEP